MQFTHQGSKISELWLQSPLGLRFCRLFLVALSLCFSAAATHAQAPTQEPPESVTFGGDAAYPPFEWLEGSSPTGYNIDLAKAIAGMSHTQVRHRLGTWPEILRALETGAVDVVPMFVSPGRQEQFLFTTPFHYVNHAIYALPDTAPVYTVEGLAQKRVAVEERSFAERQLAVDTIGAVAVPEENTVEALNAVAEGRADYAVLAAPAADRLIYENQLILKRLGPPFWPRSYAFAVRKDRPDLQYWLQQALDLAIVTGAYQQVYEKWEPRLTFSEPDTSIIVRRTIVGLSGLAVLAALAFCWSWTLRRKVQARTSELRRALERVHDSESRAQRLALFDEETGLAKPHHFSHLVDEELGKSNTASKGRKELLILQLTGLDDVVGAFGKTYSNEWTRQFADHLRTLFHGPCAYFGRGVFAMFSERELAPSLSELLGKKLRMEGIYAQLVGGSAYFPDHGTSSSELIAKSETALTAGLSSGRQWVLYDPALEPDPLNTAIVSAFRDNPVEGLGVVFQPQIDLDSGTVIAAEALVRWNHPSLGAIGPDKFIPLIEKVGLISRVTEMMINEAARLSALLRGLDHRITISVNITTWDLVSSDLPGILAKALARYEAQPSDLKLELTETSFASDSAKLQGVLHQIRQLGVNIAIDDFGTGYSSLSYLSLFPVQELKIDRSFVSDMGSNERHRNIVRSTILLAQQLNLVSVAEGAEDAETVRSLESYGCDRVQGYVFSKPLSEAALIEFVERNSGQDLVRGSLA